MIVCFTGHRPNKLGGWDGHNAMAGNVRAALHNAIVDVCKEYATKEPVLFITGMAQGVDMWAADAVAQVRDLIYNNVILEAYIPFVGQQNKWPLTGQKDYLKIICNCNRLHFVDEEGYAPWKLLNRNKAMVDKADLVIAVWNGDEKGGTAHCVRYAKSKDKKIINLWDKIEKST